MIPSAQQPLPPPRAYKYLHALVSSTDRNSKRYMRPLKNTPHVAKVMMNPSYTEPSHMRSPPCHHNSRQSCCTVCPRCLTRGRWPKSPSNLDTATSLKLPHHTQTKQSSPMTKPRQTDNKGEGRQSVAGQSWIFHVGLFWGGKHIDNANNQYLRLFTQRNHQSWVSHVGSLGSVSCLLKSSLWHFCLRGASRGPNPLDERAEKSAIGMLSLTSGFAI